MKFTALATLIACGIAAHAHAGNWTLDGDASHLAFGSIKNDYTAEVHSFAGLSGQATDEAVSVTIDLSTVQTNIDIRDERMQEHVFAGLVTAELSAAIDLAQFDALAAGESATTEFDGTLSFLGEDVSVYTNVVVFRLGDDSVMVTTNDMVFLATDELGIDSGIDTLQELASLDGITRATPVTARLVFTRED
ncbi:YceI family protein [uncultured Roseobacter sp.]|uniref:YceI family protein n=1 Tax=uncultured Roseobacter sp. TaxID=114847 RepID=UPI002635C2F8|nr:YceI family protein [uncultured Roseobacter sp.]